ncbi:cation:proton antiporter [Gellertiella hungarica]|uniref:Multicomponent Na+:H+ antiporter subunit F n=1 Tax=Gellertiella hungarica TaxID=1572859 RepID=A0A7W6J6M1_9HYPH|nr:cation:proton antiporter [Gellertiella hungarica]MBB4065760.1 multicomponent Na+:H+ antiporter subunit F [Gellertiella hungarica]
MSSSSLLALAATIALPVLALSLAATAWRVVRGPTLADRVLALDMLTAIAIGFMAVFSILTGYSLYIDIAIALGLVGFLATVAFARFILTRPGRKLPDTPPDRPRPNRPGQRRRRA